MVPHRGSTQVAFLAELGDALLAVLELLDQPLPCLRPKAPMQGTLLHRQWGVGIDRRHGAGPSLEILPCDLSAAEQLAYPVAAGTLTCELTQNGPLRFKRWGGRRGSNPRQPESQSGTLPTELRPPSSNNKLARPAGIEPATAGLEGRCSIRLSYGRNGRGRGIRTPDPLLPKQMRYQTAPCPDARPTANQWGRNAIRLATARNKKQQNATKFKRF